VILNCFCIFSAAKTNNAKTIKTNENKITRKTDTKEICFYFVAFLQIQDLFTDCINIFIIFAAKL